MHAVAQAAAEDLRKVSLVSIAATNYARIIGIRICRTNERRKTGGAEIGEISGPLKLRRHHDQP